MTGREPWFSFPLPTFAYATFKRLFWRRVYAATFRGRWARVTISRGAR